MARAIPPLKTEADLTSIAQARGMHYLGGGHGLYLKVGAHTCSYVAMNNNQQKTLGTPETMSLADAVRAADIWRGTVAAEAKRKKAAQARRVNAHGAARRKAALPAQSAVPAPPPKGRLLQPAERNNEILSLLAGQHVAELTAHVGSITAAAHALGDALVVRLYLAAGEHAVRQWLERRAAMLTNAIAYLPAKD